MFEIGNHIIYKRDVCQIKNIKEKNNIDYYELVPIDDDTLKIEVPVNNESIKSIMSIQEVSKLIEKIPNIEVVECNDKMIEVEYKKLLSTGNKEDLIKIIKTTYLRNKERIENKKKISDKDNTYFLKAERILYNEISIVLNLTFDETKEYIIDKVTEMMK